MEEGGHWTPGPIRRRARLGWGGGATGVSTLAVWTERAWTPTDIGVFEQMNGVCG